MENRNILILGVIIPESCTIHTGSVVGPVEAFPLNTSSFPYLLFLWHDGDLLMKMAVLKWFTCPC